MVHHVYSLLTGTILVSPNKRKVVASTSANYEEEICDSPLFCRLVRQKLVKYSFFDKHICLVSNFGTGDPVLV